MENNSNKKINLNEFVYPVVMFLAGVCFIIFDYSILDISLYIIGSLFFIAGIVLLARKEVRYGLLYLFIGLVIVLLGALIVEIAIATIGAILLIVGTLNLLRLISGKDVEFLCYVSPFILISVGFLLVLGNLYQFLDFVISSAGICLVMYGIYRILFLVFQIKTK